MRKGAFLVAALLAASFSMMTPAGTGESPYCFDGTWTDVPLLPGPVTVGIELNTGSPGTWVTVCYATSEVGYTGAHLTGGYLKVFVAPDGSGSLLCNPDDNSYAASLVCVGSFSFSPTTGGLSVTFVGTADTNVTEPVTVGLTGLTVSPFVFIGPGVSVVPQYPCIYVLGTQVVPNCGDQIIQ